METIFEGSAHVELQGDHALTYLSHTADSAEYQVNGFTSPRIFIHDYRPSSVHCLTEALQSEDFSKFAPQFNVPASIHVLSRDSGDLLIELRSTKITDPVHRLWFAIGIRDTIPVYEYLFSQIAPWEEEGFAFAALYQRYPLTQEGSFSLTFSKAIS
jgi:hypothetical protein